MIPRPIAVALPPNPRDWKGPGLSFRPSTVPLIASAIVFAFLLYYAQYSISVQWVLGVFGVAIVALFAWSMIVRKTSEPPPLVGPRSREEIREGELAFLAAGVKRAFHGLPYSQIQVASRARVAFLERVALALALSAETMAAVQRNPVELHRILDDPALERFVRMEVGDLDDRSRWVREARAAGGMPAEFQDILTRMEAWH